VDDRPITGARPAARRVGARCHAFSRFTVAFLRAAGVAARARCGFGAYFRPGWFEDHWVASTGTRTSARWQLVDPQLDTTRREKIGFTGDALAISADEFVTALGPDRGLVEPGTQEHAGRVASPWGRATGPGVPARSGW
jgi:hypothetical protein